MIRTVHSCRVAACRSTSSTTNTLRRSAPLPSPPGRDSPSPLRHQSAASTCLVGGHALWWRVQADDAAGALALLPQFVARRTVPIEIRDVEIP